MTALTAIGQPFKSAGQMILDLLKSLGANETVWYQLAILMVTFFFLSRLLFRPYLKAFEKREQLTLGGEEIAANLVAETQNLETEYEVRAREINGTIKLHFDNARNDARRECEKLISEARQRADDDIKKKREEIAAVCADARRRLSGEVPVLGVEIAQRLLGKS